MSKVPIFSIFCIDYRYDKLTADYFQGIGLVNSYFASTAAGAALPLGYRCSCCNLCPKGSCNPINDSMNLLRDSLVKNLEIALSLKPITTVYLLNHQDCKAIKAFLGCSGYPMKLGDNNQKEIDINAVILTYAQKYMLKLFPIVKFCLCVIDINGSVADYDPITKTWIKVYTGTGNNPLGLWYNL